MLLVLSRNVECLILCIFLLYIFFILMILNNVYSVLLVLEISGNGSLSLVLKLLCECRLLCDMLMIFVLVFLNFG